MPQKVLTMKKALLILICAAALLLTGCQQATLARQLETLSEVLDEVGPLLTVTPEPTPTPYPEWMMAPTPGSVPYISPTPAPTPVPDAPEVPQEEQDWDADEPSATYATGQEVADLAQQYVGYNYVWGGMSPETGFDCSGLVYYVYQQFGYELNRTASAQAGDGSHVENDALEPGDILCFYKNGGIGHAGIYVGDGNYVHAQDSATGVIVSPLSERKGGFEARRILK